MEFISTEQVLLAKFPSFNSVWPEKVQLKWFDDFKKLREMFDKYSKPKEATP